MRSFTEAKHRNNDDNILLIMRGELHDKDATAIDDFYKSLKIQKSSLDGEIKSRINLNQKNILQLTDDLRVTQEELLLLRVLTKEFLSILSDFADAAERRLALEKDEPRNTDSATLNNGGNRSARNKKKDRLSVLVLEKMWATELESLYKHVDGAQKYTQPIPGRHVLAESGRWHEINVGTWKASRPIHLFLLNDLVLIATRKLSQEGSSKRLQAIYCWPLHAVELTEIKPPEQLANKDDKKLYFINLRGPSFSYVYQTDRYDHFVRVTNAYTRGKTELLQKERTYETEDMNGDFAGGSTNPNSPNLVDEKADLRHLRNSLRNTAFSELSTVGPGEEGHRRTSSQRHSNDMVLQDISARVHSRNRSHDFNDRQSGNRIAGLASLSTRLFIELKNAEDKLDEVDVNLAQSEYSAATQIMTQIEDKLSSIVTRINGIGGKDKSGSVEELRLLVDVVRLKLSNRKYKLQQNLQFDLHHSILTYTNEEIKEILSYYAQFDIQSEGISVVLEALSAHLSTTVGKLISGAHGSTKIEILNYISNLTIIYVLIVLKALSIYNGCIDEIVKTLSQQNLDSSGFITWCVAEMTRLVDTIKKHADGTILLYSNDSWAVKDKQHYKELLSVLEPQLDLLKQEGLNVRYLFDDIIGSHMNVVT